VSFEQGRHVDRTWCDAYHERLQREWDRDDKSDLAWTVALTDELHRRGSPVWYLDGRPVSFIEDDWSDDFPLVWRDGWFSTAA
jgi:hypothetical protein